VSVRDAHRVQLQSPRPVSGRRMADGAAHLVDHILPLGADYRQWTLSFRAPG